MLSRCLNPADDNFKYYGGRGIEICQAWQDSFAGFLSDMGERPEGTSLDRKQTDGNYTPDNCRWATAQEQARNRRSNVHIEHDETNQTVTEWADKVGKSRSTLYHRLKAGWSQDDTLNVPIGNVQGRRAILYTYQGEELSLLQWAERTGIPAFCLRKRIMKYKWTLERALTTPVNTDKHSVQQKRDQRRSKTGYT